MFPTAYYAMSVSGFGHRSRTDTYIKLLTPPNEFFNCIYLYVVIQTQTSSSLLYSGVLGLILFYDFLTLSCEHRRLLAGSWMHAFSPHQPPLASPMCAAEILKCLTMAISEQFLLKAYSHYCAYLLYVRTTTTTINTTTITCCFVVQTL
uniref:Uncharacterized protein n=1 Tax=Glossina palpalis gambiensis TaxID=67801 RepID=A0A1B0BMX6_9MUSC